MTLKILAMGGDGIGPEVVDASLKVLDVAASSVGLKIDLCEDLLHGAAWEKYGTFIRPETLERARQSDALLVGAVGGPQWDHIQIEGGPSEQDGLMKTAQRAGCVCLHPLRQSLGRTDSANTLSTRVRARRGCDCDAGIVRRRDVFRNPWH